MIYCSTAICKCQHRERTLWMFGLILTNFALPNSQAKLFPDVPIYGGSNKAPALTHIVKDKDEVTFGDITIRYSYLPSRFIANEELIGCFRALHTPCHTQDSICFHATPSDGSHPGGVFTGDTLFIAGCGRFFEGTAAEMNAALKYLGTLPDNTIVYNGHEYTKGNLAFAKSVDPDNEAIKRLDKLVQENEITTGLTTVGDEKEWNPFVRLDSPSIRYNLVTQRIRMVDHRVNVNRENTKSESASEDDLMQTLRELKNNFKG